MATMTELKKIAKETENISTVKVGEGIEIKVKGNIPLEEKLEIVELVAQNAIKETDEGVFYIDHTMKEIVFDTLILKHYTDVKLPKNTIELLDAIDMIGIKEEILNCINEADYFFLTAQISRKIEEIMKIQEKKTKGIFMIKSILDSLNENMPELMEQMKKLEAFKAVEKDA